MIDNIKNITHALQSLRPRAQWVMRGENYSDIEWVDTVQTKPSQLEVLTEIQRLQEEWTATEYQRLRAPQYPPMSDYLDAVYWQSQGDETKMTAYLAAVEAVKDQFPKP